MQGKFWLGAVMSVLWVAAAALGESSVGWRTDGSGAYPQAKPVLQWSATAPLVWQTAMPAASNATPVVLSDRLLVCSEPGTLLCLSKNDGHILWQQSLSFLDQLTPEQQAKAQEQNKHGDAIAAQLQPLTKALNSVRAQLKKTPDDAGLKQKEQDLLKQAAPLQETLKAISEWRLPPTHPVNGYTSPTPVSDGKSVWVLYGSGLLARYDLEGNRQWFKVLEKSEGNGHSASPLLIGDRLCVLMRGMLYAFDAASGKEIWKVPAKVRPGSLVRASVGGCDLVVTPAGDVVRAADGKVLLTALAGLEYNTPVVGGEGDTLYYIQEKSKALRLSPGAEGELKSDVLWEATIMKDRYYSSPLLHQGLIYAIQQAGVLSVLDATDGKLVYEEKLPLGKGTVYPSVTLGGETIFISSDNGTTLTLKPGRTFVQLGKNTLAPFRSSPVFEGSRMYVRALGAVYCVGQ